MTIWNMLLSIVVTLAITIVVHAQTNETECKKASASDVCCKKPGCMWVSCMHTPYFQKPIPLTECHATSWELEVCKTIPDIVCPTGFVIGIGAFCRDVGGECEDIPGAYCNTSANMQYNIAKANCQCAAIYLPGNRHDTNCTAISCNNNSTCVSLDPNSECVNSKCACRGGFEINRNSSVGLCVLKSATTIAPAATTITDKCGSYGDNNTACCTAAATEGCKYVTCSMNGTVGVCYKLDSTLDTKCENVTTMKPADQCSTVTTPTPDPCAAFTDQGACCGASIQCRYINCTDKDSQAHTGCHGKNSDLTSVCSKVKTNMCKYAYVDSKRYITFEDNVKMALKSLHDMLSGIKSNQDQMLKRVDALEKALLKVDKKLDKQIDDLKDTEKELKALKRESRRQKTRSVSIADTLGQTGEIVREIEDEQKKLEKAVRKLHA